MQQESQHECPNPRHSARPQLAAVTGPRAAMTNSQLPLPQLTHNSESSPDRQLRVTIPCAGTSANPSYETFGRAPAELISPLSWAPAAHTHRAGAARQPGTTRCSSPVSLLRPPPAEKDQSHQGTRTACLPVPLDRVKLSSRVK